MRWEHFHHGADWGVRGIGASKAEAFAGAALALTAVLIDPEALDADEATEIACEAPDDELLLVEWLGELVYQMDAAHRLFARFALVIEDHRLRAKAWFETMGLGKHELAVDVKGVTYTELKVSQDDRGDWIAQCVVDV